MSKMTKKAPPAAENHLADRKESVGKNLYKQAGAASVVLSAVLFGTMPLLAKVAYQHGSNAYSVAFGRFFFGSILLFVIILAMPGGSIKIPGRQLWQILKLSVSYALVPVLLYVSYEYIDSGLATTLHFTYPVAVIIILAVLFGIKPDRKQLLCAFLCTVGILLLYTPNGQVSVKGILFAVVSGLLYALYIILLGRSEAKTIAPLTLAFWLAFFSALEIGLISVLLGKMELHMDAGGWAAEVILALFATVFALVLFQKGLFLCGEVKASLLSTFEPLTGIVIGILVFHEVLTGKEGLGIACVLLSTIILVIPMRKDSEKECAKERKDT